MHPKSFIIIIFSLFYFHGMANAQGMIIREGGNIIINNSNIVLDNNWVNNGHVSCNSGVVIFAGSSQTISGTSPTLFNNLTVASGSTTVVNTSGQMVKAILLSNGTLHADSNLTLLSTSSQTALIDGSGSGEVLGKVIMQRYLARAFGYKYFSSPFQHAAVDEFSDDINLAASFPTFYRYNENNTSSGWAGYINADSSLTPLQGYAANFGSSSVSKTVDITGVVNNHTISSSTLYNHNRPYTLGFNLVGNPYPSPVDWDIPGGWVRTNIDNAIYYFNAGTTDQYTGTYSSYINGVSSDGVAGHFIAAMQGFFVHVTDGTFPVSGTLSINNNARVNNLTPVFHKSARIANETIPLIRLYAGYDDDKSLSDPLVVYFDDQATPAFDKDRDALKLMNTNNKVPSLYAISPDTARLSISAVPTPDNTVVLPLGLITETGGWVSFHVYDMQQIPSGMHIYLSDAETNSMQDLHLNSQYKAFIRKGPLENRFSLVFTKQILLYPPSGTMAGADSILFKAYSSGRNLFASVDIPSGDKGNIIIANSLGQVIWKKEAVVKGDYQYQLPFAGGVYIVSFYTGKQVFTKKIFIGM